MKITYTEEMLDRWARRLLITLAAVAGAFLALLIGLVTLWLGVDRDTSGWIWAVSSCLLAPAAMIAVDWRIRYCERSKNPHQHRTWAQTKARRDTGQAP